MKFAPNEIVSVASCDNTLKKLYSLVKTYYRLQNQSSLFKELQPKTKVVGKVCKTLKNDTTFRFQLNLRGTQRFL